MRHLLMFVLFPCYLAAAVQLQFLPSIPVQQTCSLVVDVQESEPILSMTTKGNQNFKFDLLAKSSSPSTKGLTLPATVTLTIRDVSIRVNANGQEAVFDPTGQKNSPALNAFSHLLNQPLNLVVDAHGNLESNSETFDRLLKEYPALSDLPLDSLVNDLVSDLFALYGEELSPGAKIEMQSSPGPAFAFPAYVTYEITEINNKEITATLNGRVDSKKVALEKTIRLNGRPQKVEMIISGTLKGKASWQRSNAMLYNLNCDYFYDAKLRSRDKQWTMKMKVSQTITSAPLDLKSP
ncbi:MAG: hypothetical protein WCG42_04305 [Parachlamydiaceae bacterium]